MHKYAVRKCSAGIDGNAHEAGILPRAREKIHLEEEALGCEGRTIYAIGSDADAFSEISAKT